VSVNRTKQSSFQYFGLFCWGARGQVPYPQPRHNTEQPQSQEVRLCHCFDMAYYHSSSDDSSAPFFESSRGSSSSEEEVETVDELLSKWLTDKLRRVTENDPFMTDLAVRGEYHMIQNMTDEDWEQLGQDITNNNHLERLTLWYGALDDHKMSPLFRGLTRSNSIEDLRLDENGLSASGVRSMMPFLRNANSLTHLHLNNNNIQSEGFNMLLRAFRDSPLETLYFNKCGIESIDIDSNDIPPSLRVLRLSSNSISTDGCRELSKLLQGADPTLKELYLDNNNIDDEGVAILIDALQNNTSLKELDLSDNERISIEGAKSCLRLVSDISSIQATVQSNRSLQMLEVKKVHYNDDDDDENSQIQRIQRLINRAVVIHGNYENRPEAAGREKVIWTQLNSERRAELAKLQGVDRSLYSEINPLHLPEVLTLVGLRHGQEELYVALKSSIAGVISTVNRKECIQQQRDYYAAKLEELDTELATIEAAEGHVVEIEESRSNKRRRKWWWGLWGGA
jgi:Ran GTPase-activating protein (RanGAP) involved in mRNA processing and transport